MSILVTFMHPRTCANILPALHELAENGEEVYCFLYYKMASLSSWPATSPNPQPFLVKRMEAGKLKIIADTHAEGVDLGRKFRESLSCIQPELIIMDSNKGKMHWGTPLLYQEARKGGIPVIGCQEGSVDDGEAGLKPIAEGLGINFDYCFCLGQFDKELLLARNRNLHDRLTAVGLPSNDLLKPYSKTNDNLKKHVLMVPSWTETAAKSTRFQPMPGDVLESSGVSQLSKEFGLPIMIKEKTREKFAFKHLESEDIKITMDEINLDEIIAASACIIGAPSTLLFKGIQLGIPTAVLGKPVMGQLGVFREFTGLTNSTPGNVVSTIHKQRNNQGTQGDFIERAIRGGATFACSRLFIEGVRAVLADASSYTGKRMWSMGLKKGLAQRFPRQYHALQSIRNGSTTTR